MFCSKCGADLPNGAKFCAECGAKVAEGQRAASVSTHRSSVDRRVAFAVSGALAGIAALTVLAVLLIRPFGGGGGDDENGLTESAPTPAIQWSPTSVQPSPTPGSGGPRVRAGRYLEAIVGAPARVNPLFAPLNGADADLASLVFSGLTRLGPNGEVLPDLAESWEKSDDGLTYTFHLRNDVTWHTGTPFTVEDAVFTYEMLADPELPSDPTLGQLWRDVSCTAADETSLQCKLPEPSETFLAHTAIGLLPKHVLEGVAAGTIAENPFNQAPAGTGPYRLAQLERTKAILLANPTYYGDKPAIVEVEFRFFPDPSTAAAALSHGEVHGLLLAPSASQEDFDLLTSTPGLRAYTASGTAYTYFVAEEIQGIEIGTLVTTAARFSSITQWTTTGH